ncbi:DeoR family transcriptional regulator, partial [Salmonella enterica subsp. enterica]
MDSRKAERLKLIQQALQDQNAIHLREMAALLDVSEMTLRRDLNHFSDHLRLLGGYITRGGSEVSEY